MNKSMFSTEGTFSRFMNFLWDLILLSILWLLCSLPIVTLCASSTAAYYTAAKVLRRHNGCVLPEFFRAFRQNFKQSTALSVSFLIILFILVFDCTYLYNNTAKNSLALLYMCYLMILMTVANLQYQCPLLSRFHMSGFQLLKTSVVLMFRHLISTILLLLILATTFLAVYLMPWGILVFPGVAVYAQTFLMEPILRRCAPEPEEGSEEAQKWYYQ